MGSLEVSVTEFRNELDASSVKSLRFLDRLLDEVPPAGKGRAAFVAQQVEAAKVIIASKLRYAGLGADGTDVNEMFESFKIEYRRAVPHMRPENVITGHVLTLEELME